MSLFGYLLGALFWVILAGGFVFIIFLYDIVANYVAAIFQNLKERKAAQKHWDDAGPLG